MDIEKVIDILHDIMVEGFTVGDRIFDMEPDESEAIQTSMSGLQELQQYRQIGTVDECRAAREKQIPKKPIDDKYRHKCCPACGWVILLNGVQEERFTPHCENCGQAIEWN